jgi:hypothetical protein
LGRDIAYEIDDQEAAKKYEKIRKKYEKIHIEKLQKKYKNPEISALLDKYERNEFIDLGDMEHLYEKYFMMLQSPPLAYDFLSFAL